MPGCVRVHKENAKNPTNKNKQFVAPYLLFGDYYLAKNNLNNSLQFYESSLEISVEVYTY